MRKALFGVFLTLLAAVTLLFFLNFHVSVGVIGGADGPTSIFVTGAG